MKPLFCIILTIITFSIYAETWTLEQCLLYAAEKNLQIKQADLSEQLAKSNEFQSLMQLLTPRLNADGSLSQNYGRSVDPTTYSFVNQKILTNSLSLTGSVTLFSGLSQIYNLKQNKMNVEASEADKKNTLNNVALTITRAYLQVLLSKEQLKASQAQLKLSEEQFKQAKILVEVGNVPLGNQLDAEAQLAQDTLNYLVALNTVTVAKLTLSILLQLEPQTDFDVEAPVFSLSDNPDVLNETAESVYASAMQTQPMIKSAFFRLQSARYRMMAAKGFQSPTINAFVNSRTNYSSGFKEFTSQTIPNEFDTIGFFSGFPITTQKRIVATNDIAYYDQLTQNISNTIGVSINIPILNGWQTRNAIKAAKINYQSASLQQLQTENQLKQDVYTAYYEAQNALQTYEAAQKSLNAFKKSLEYNEERYKIGALNSLQFNTVRTSYANAEIQEIRARYDYVFKLKVLDFYKGNPLTLN
jgi:outer membrane protein